MSKAEHPIVTGQCAEVLTIIRQHQPILSLTLTADFAIPEAAARVHDLRNLGYNVITEINSEIVFRGRVRRGVASYSLGTPEWSKPCFIEANPIQGSLSLEGVMHE